MAQLRQGYDELIGHDTAVVVVGPEGTQAFLMYWKQNTLPSSVGSTQRILC